MRVAVPGNLLTLNGRARPAVLTGLLFLALLTLASPGLAESPVNSASSEQKGNQWRFPVVVDRKMGFMDQKGNLVIPAQYAIMNSHANTEWKPLPAWIQVEAESEDYQWESNSHVIDFPVFHNRFCNIVKDDLLGYVREDGKVVIEPRFLKGSGFINGVAFVVEKGEVNCLLRDDGTIIAKGFQDCKEFREGLAPIRVGDQWGYVNLDGQYVIPLQYTEASTFGSGRAEVQDDQGKKWHIDRSGNVCPRAASRSFCCEGKAMDLHKETGKWGYVDIHDQVVIPYQFDDASTFECGLAAVSTGGKYGYIDHRGEFVIQPVYDRASSFSEGRALVGQKGADGLRWGLIDQQGVQIVPMQYRDISPSTLIAGKEYLSSGDSGKLKELPQGIAIVQTEEGCYCLIDMEGNAMHQARYKSLIIAQGGQLIAKTESGVGIIDWHGREIVAPRYEDIWWRMSEGLRLVYEQGKGWGFIDEFGTLVIEPSFGFANDFHHGLARVAVDIQYCIPDEVVGGKWGYINELGEWVWKPTR